MKEKVLVTYSVKYSKEVELEITEEIKELLDEGKVINWDEYDNLYNILSTQDECLNLPIPNTFSYDNKFGQEFETVEYVDSSFDIEKFEKQL